jgi:HEAT repeat protein
MVFGLFSKERALERAIKKVTNKLTQSPDRYGAMEKLREIGSEEALFGLLRRFSITSMKLIEDQEEKEWVVEVMAAHGPAVLPALRRYMKQASSIAYPLRILEQVADHDTAMSVVDEVLAGEQPGYTRDPDKRNQLIGWLTEYRAATDDEVVTRVAPYLADFDENVRFAATESLSQRATPAAAERLVDALVREDEESKRLKVRIAEILADQGYDLHGKKDQIAPLLDDELSDFKLHRDKLVRKKK